MTRRSTRRDFLKQSALAGVGFWVAGGRLPAASKSANEKLNIACIGVGGKGGSDVGGVSSENIVALCDVDDQRAAKSFDKHPNAKKFKDFRKMLDEMGKEIDAVTISTPDHQHAVATMAAMKLGKHVYCQKPLTHDVYEARKVMEAARKMKVVTQMGNQGTSGSQFRRTAELIQAGEIGPVQEVHVWTNRPIWPQGKSVPEKPDAVPPTLDWDLWLGTAAERPYSKAYLPFVWRGWRDFGTGAIGDMGCHTVNLPFLSLKLTYPTTIEAESSPLTAENRASYPTWAKVAFHFAARGDLPAVKLTWYEGHRDGKLVLPPAELLHGQKFSGSGSLIVGSKGTVFSSDDYGNHNVILRGTRSKRSKETRKSIPGRPASTRNGSTPARAATRRCRTSTTPPC